MATLGQYDPEFLTELQIMLLGAKHLLEQNRKSERVDDINSLHGTICLYKGPDGICCGAAPFVQNYKSYFEGKQCEEILPETSYGKTTLIMTMQGIHDEYPVTQWLTLLGGMLEQQHHSRTLLDNIDQSIADTGYVNTDVAN